MVVLYEVLGRRKLARPTRNADRYANEYRHQALVQPAYKDNWFAKPALPNNLNWSQTTVTQQMLNNNISYPQHQPAWSKYPNGAYNPQYDDYISPPIQDWDPSQPDPIWCPVAGGKGWGKPTGNCAGSSRTDTSGESATGSGLAAESPAQSVPASASTTTPVQSSPVQSTPPSSTTPGAVGPANSWNGTSGAQEQPIQKETVANEKEQGVGGSLFNEQEEEDDTCEP